MQSAETVMERVEGIEPSSPAWKAGVIAFIRYPRLLNFLVFLPDRDSLSHLEHTVSILLTGQDGAIQGGQV